MFTKKFSKILVFICILPFLLNSCANRGDARKSPPDPKERVKRNIEQGKGLRLMNTVKKKRSTNFEFASSNVVVELSSVTGIQTMKIVTKA